MNSAQTLLHIADFQAFLNLRSHQQLCFIRGLGSSPDFLRELTEADQRFPSGYLRVTQLDPLRDMQRTALCQQRYANLQNILPEDAVYSRKFDAALQEVRRLYRHVSPQSNPTIEKNLIISLLYWEETYLKDFRKPSVPRKLICSGKIGYKEYLFGYLAACLGIDVLLLLPEGEPKLDKAYLQCSLPLTFGAPGAVTIPPYQKPVQVSPRPARQSPVRTTPQSTSPLQVPRPVRQVQTLPPRQELSYEELAKLACSVVMIGMHDRFGEPTGVGSGIALSRDGYILTNCHVVRDAAAFSVRLENDDKIYTTTQVIKYHPQFDLAVLRIDRELTPIRLYDGRKELVRGQKVVAIGSPLGLFNSVSDGIIAGFREIEGMEIIQFTAPVSPGSSGGAVLNTYGELIGISTAVSARGQNINLAVSYTQIRPFVQGFLSY